MAKNKGAVKPPKGPKMGEFLISKAHELSAPRSMHLFGEPGRGKTTYAASVAGVPGIDRVLDIDFDFGSTAIAQDWPMVDVVTFRDGDIKTFQRFWDKLVANDGDGYDAIILDTVTSGQQWKTKSIETGANKYAKWDIVRDWTLDTLKELHTMTPVGIATFHTQFGDSMKGSTDEEYSKLLPMLQGSAKALVGGIADIIGFCDVVDLDEDDEDYEAGVTEIQYTLRLQPAEKTNTKNRFKLPPIIDASGGMKRMYEMIAQRSKKGA